MRTCEGFGVTRVVFSGYTPFWGQGLPHEREKLRRQIHKTALGAEEMVKCEYVEDAADFIQKIKDNNWKVLALEQADKSIELQNFRAEGDVDYALILGEEVHGVPPEILGLADDILEIPMAGLKESFNVSVAAGIAIWELMKLPNGKIGCQDKHR